MYKSASMIFNEGKSFNEPSELSFVWAEMNDILVLTYH